MEIKDWLAIMGIIVGFAGGIIVVILSDMQVFQAYPDYEVAIRIFEKLPEELFIKNIGSMQAKNSIIYINSSQTLELENYSKCLEMSSFFKIDNTNLRIDFDRISTGIPCRLEFTMPQHDQIVMVTIISDDSPGRVYFRSNEKEENKNFNVTSIKFIDPNKEFLFLYNYIIILSIFDVIVCIYFFFNLQRKRKKRLKELFMKEKEIKESLDRSQREFDLLYSNFLIAEKTPLRLGIKSRLDNVLLKINNSNRELDEIRSKIITKRMLHNMITQYYEKMRLFEQNLIDLAKKRGIDIPEFVSTQGIIDQIKSLNILEQKFFIDSEKVLNFRRQLSYGVIEPTKIQIDRNIELLTSLLPILENQLNKKD